MNVTRRIALSLCLACLGWSLSAQVNLLDSAIGRFGVIVINNTVPNSAPDPILNTLGGAVTITFADDFWLHLEPGLDLFWTNYGNDDGRAVPVESEAGDGNNVFVLGFLLDLPLMASWHFGTMLYPERRQRFTVGASLGPAFLFRAGFKGDTTAAYADKMVVNQAAVLDWFWQQGRWFYPSASLRFEALLQDDFTFVLGVRGFLAVSNLWTGLSPALDHAMLHVVLGMRIAIHPVAPTDSEAANETVPPTASPDEDSAPVEDSAPAENDETPTTGS
ncbi:MAG: hypothetical protein A2087_09450 [Spirochaetes bacterium GWD1_61_31]|nr:MAG: hypothetical protein A2Y37_09495 [Spirochaetes bacterium GWB1_60_80]OHD28507.1 MAG: hypothetical protein A2004_02555 [Spirochaetes bacterium GWC1_61_12]OHD41441.1 MAG: hypothetical protein A2Y35_05800 [Spirochaetes bacterium GWE1_60_18]OHD43692.1 MAG: hypothetical protein A2087_09450 [Spirochaetes bacterium GWD1_61_31]OHD61343.1 MAG: hypothetical protein A2Y32_04190 [Spirochaetes bacterium GWF1_60_12]HAP43341.1 hypothetical protein [Spirochaetaceae bacterium]